MPEQLFHQDGINITSMFDHRDHGDDIRLAGEIGLVLSNAYPGWGWYVDIPPNQDIVTVKNLDLDSRGKWGFCFRKSQLAASDFKKKLILGAGEVIERYRLRVGRLTDQIDVTKPIFLKPEL